MNIDAIEKLILERLRGINLSADHDFSHALRVVNYASFLAEKLKADKEIVSIAGYLHDIGRTENKSEEKHSLKSVELAASILKELNIEQIKSQAILEVIKAHSIDEIGKLESFSKEALCIFIADKVDGLGAIGISRIFLEAGRKGRDINKTIDYVNEKYFSKEEKLMKIAKRLKLTEDIVGQKILNRLDFSKTFFNHLIEELEFFNKTIQN